MMQSRQLPDGEQITWLACGENCMPINVLRRHNKEAPSTPFSAGRSDVEQLKYFEDNQYANLLNPDYILKANAYSEDCYLNISKKSSGLCRPGKHLYLEFTHHNPNNERDYDAIERRIKRMLEYRTNGKKIVFMYHHRSTTGFKKSKAHIKNCFIDILKHHNRSATVLCYSQQIAKEDAEENLSVLSSNKGRIIFYTLKTAQQWAGNNLNIFFGRNEDKLFEKMLKTHEHLIKNL